MTREVVTLTEGALAREALRVMQDQDIRHVPILRAGKLVGVVSDRDLIRVLPGSVAELETEEGWQAETTPLGRVMTVDPLTLSPGDLIEDAAQLMMRERVSGFPVVDDSQTMVGILTTVDVLRALASIGDGNGGRRVALLHPPDREEGSFDPVALAVRLGLRLAYLASVAAPNGGRITVLRLEGPDAHVTSFARIAVSAGLVLIGAAPGGKSDKGDRGAREAG